MPETAVAVEISSTDVRNHLTEIMYDVIRLGGRVMILKHGKPVGALVSVKDLEEVLEKRRVKKPTIGRKEKSRGRKKCASKKRK